MGTYADFLDIQARIPYRSIEAATKPSQGNTEEWLDEAEATLNGALQAAGLPAPYSSTQAIRILRSWVVDYAEGMVRQAYASAGGDGGNDDGKDLLEKFAARIKDIIENPGTYGAMLGGGDAPDTSRRVYSYVTDNTDGKSVDNGDFAPTFVRGDLY